MSAKAISEATAKDLLNRLLDTSSGAARCKFAAVNETTNWNEMIANNPWLQTEFLSVKPDHFFKRRKLGELSLIEENNNLNHVKEWVTVQMGKVQKIGNDFGKLRQFIIEPFIPHKDDDEAYVCIYSDRTADSILFYQQTSVYIGDMDSNAIKLDVAIDHQVTVDEIEKSLLGAVGQNKKRRIADFISKLYKLYIDAYFTYLEINPLVVTDDSIYILDLAAKLDSTADFICGRKWGNIEYPPPFGHDAFPEEAYITELGAGTGACLKLCILNRDGRIWTMVAGGGASVIYSDTICELGGSEELANYGEYSGAPSEQQTYEYATTILNLMTSSPKHPQGKILIIGGGIANFTNVATTFRGITTALHEFQPKLVEHNVSIFVRRGGPKYQEGLRNMCEIASKFGITLFISGPETSMTAICGMALGKLPIPQSCNIDFATADVSVPGCQQQQEATKVSNAISSTGLIQAEIKLLPTSTGLLTQHQQSVKTGEYQPMFNNRTKAIFRGMQTRAVQSMLDFDSICGRDEPSVAAMVYPLAQDHTQKFYFKNKAVLIPFYKYMQNAITNHKDADVVVNFASVPSAYESTIEVLDFSQIRTIAIISKGIPDNLTRKLKKKAKERGVSIIGPGTVGGVKPGSFKIGYTGGMADNILYSKLYRPGSVAYVSRSSGISNELNNIISKSTDGVFEGVTVGRDRFPGTTFMDHILRYEKDPGAKLIVLLGEAGGVEEYEVCEGLKDGRITKPLVAWCIGTCAGMLISEVQFGHGGPCADSDRESATAKNAALKAAGAYTSSSFDALGELIGIVYKKLVKTGQIVPVEEVPPPTVPIDYSSAREIRNYPIEGHVVEFPKNPTHPNQFKNSKFWLNESIYVCFKTKGLGRLYFCSSSLEHLYADAIKTGAEKTNLLIMDMIDETHDSDEFNNAVSQRKKFLFPIRTYLQRKLELTTEFYLNNSAEFLAGMHWDDIFKLTQYNLTENMIISEDPILVSCGDHLLTDEKCMDLTVKYLSQFKSAENDRSATVVWIVDDTFNLSEIPPEERKNFKYTRYGFNTKSDVTTKNADGHSHGTTVARLVGISSKKDTEIKLISAANETGGISLRLVAEGFNYIMSESRADQFTIVNCSFISKRLDDMTLPKVPLIFKEQHILIHDYPIILVTSAGNEGMANPKDEYCFPYCREICSPWIVEQNILNLFSSPLQSFVRVFEDIECGSSLQRPTKPCPACVHVGAHTNGDDREICGFSSGGCEVDVVALGSGICLDNLPHRVSGTSYASAIVCGAVSHFLHKIPYAQQRNPGSLVKNLKELLKRTADNVECKWLGKSGQRHKEHALSLALNFGKVLQEIGGAVGDSGHPSTSQVQHYYSPTIGIGFAAPTIKLVINEIIWKSGKGLIGLSLVAIIAGMLTQYLCTMHAIIF